MKAMETNQIPAMRTRSFESFDLVKGRLRSIASAYSSITCRSSLELDMEKLINGCQQILDTCDPECFSEESPYEYYFAIHLNRIEGSDMLEVIERNMSIGGNTLHLIKVTYNGSTYVMTEMSHNIQ